MNRNKIGRTALLIALIAIISLTYNILISSRSHVFVDELISFYRSSELCGNEERIDWFYPEKGINHIYTGEDFLRQLGVNEDNSLLNKNNVDKLPGQLVFGRQYFVFLNILTTITGKFFAVEDAIILNTILLIVSLLLIYVLASDMNGSWKYGIIAVIMAGTAGGVFISFGYYRFYILYAVYAVLLVYFYYLLHSRDYSILRQLVLIILGGMATWFGYRNAEYMVVFSLLMLIGYVILEMHEKAYSKVISVLVVYIPAGAFAGIKMYPSIAYALRYGETDGYHLDQMRIAFNNFFARPFGTFVFFGKVFLGYFLRFSFSPYVFGTLLCVVLVSGIWRYKKGYVLFDKFQIMLGSVIMCYLIVVAKIAPYDTWRYINICFFLGIILVTGLFKRAELGKYKKVMTIFLLICNMIFFCTYGQSKALEILEAYGTTVTEREYMHANYNQNDNVYFYEGNLNNFFYGAYLWPRDSRFYLTSFEAFKEDTDEKEEILNNDLLYVWIDYEESSQEEADACLLKEGFVRKQLVLDTGAEGGHYVYEYGKR